MTPPIPPASSGPVEEQQEAVDLWQQGLDGLHRYDCWDSDNHEGCRDIVDAVFAGADIASLVARLVAVEAERDTLAAKIEAVTELANKWAALGITTVYESSLELAEMVRAALNAGAL